MSHRDRVISAIAGGNPDRFPMWYGADPETTSNIAEYLEIDNNEESVLQALGIDFRTVRPEYTGPDVKTYQDGSRDSIWGVRRGGAYYGQALNHPLADAESIQDVERHPWPSVDDWDAVAVKEEAERLKTEYAVIGGAWSPFFHDAAELFGMETLFMKMVEQPEVVEAAIDKCLDFYLELSRRMFEEMAESLDILFFGNDFGSQTGLLCSPSMWRRFFGPGVRAMVDLGHEYGLKTALHSCGSIYEILPDLIDMGLDIVNPIQTMAAGMDPESLEREYGRDIVFFGGIDVQHVLTAGSVDDVRKEVRRIADIFRNSKGFILAPAHDYLLPEVPAENIVAMYRSGMEIMEGNGR